MNTTTSTGAAMAGQGKINISVNGVEYTREEWDRLRMLEKLDRIIALLEQIAAK